MRNFATDIQELLKDGNFEVGYTDIYIDYAENDGDHIAVYTVGGLSPDRAINPEEDLGKPMVRIYVYHRDQAKAEKTINDIVDYLKSQINILIGDTRYCCFYDRNGVNYEGRDNNKRVGYFINIGTIRRKENGK